MEPELRARGQAGQIWRWPALIVVVVVAIDQLTKYLIWNQLGPTEGTSTPVLGDWLRLTLVKNTGVAFGMFQDIPQFFTVTSLLISGGALYFYRYHLPNQRPLVQVCIGLIVGGAFGNIIDRIRLGFVIDFIHVTWFPGIFNVADSAITIGVLALASFLMMTGEGEGARPSADPVSPQSDA